MLVEGLDTDAENVEIVSIIAGGWNNYIRDTQKLNGYAKQKIEQSKIIGLRPVLVSRNAILIREMCQFGTKIYISLKTSSEVAD